MSTLQVSTLEFRKNIYKWIDKLPIEVVSKGKIVFFVIPPDGTLPTSTMPIKNKVSTDSTIPIENKPEKIPGVVKGVIHCKHGSLVGLCKFGC